MAIIGLPPGAEQLPEPMMTMIYDDIWRFLFAWLDLLG